MLSIIVAMSRNRVIGREGRLPWRLPSDLDHFKSTTLGHIVIMGRKTFESIDVRFRPLEGRANYVLTTHTGWEPTFGQPGAIHLIHSWGEALKLAQEQKEVFVIGGESIFKLALASPLTKRIYLTTVETQIAGDIFFPEFEQ